MLGNTWGLRVVSPAGTAVTYQLGKYHVVTQCGYTDERGRWGAWPGAFFYTAAYEDGVNSKVVIKTGDMLLPFIRAMSPRRSSRRFTLE
jgi:2,5-dihydroxypyridine 5,6-dioxygenase